MDDLIKHLEDLANKDRYIYQYLNHIKLNPHADKALLIVNLLSDVINKNRVLEEMITIHMQKCAELNRFFPKD